ncbi:unnamed protein product [Cunninghamella echinulata]
MKRKATLVKMMLQEYCESNIYLANKWLTVLQLQLIEFCDDLNIIQFSERPTEIMNSTSASTEHQIIRDYSKLVIVNK